jgi:hydroxybutyrate-dimer hydrolase
VNHWHGEVRETAHRHGDDLLSAGLGLDGLRAPPVPFAMPAAPTPAELRRRAIGTGWRGLVDLGPLGGFGQVYGGVPTVPGREYMAFATVPGAEFPHRVLVQAPDTFDARQRCLVVAASSGSRGVYGAVPLAGAWALPRGCAVAYTDKAAGAGYFDPADGSGVALDGTRGTRGPLEFVPRQRASGLGIKHAHSGDHPERDWGRHVLQAAQFGLAMLDRAYPALAPFTAQNTRIIATGLSNGGGAVLQAAGIDDSGILNGVVALEPNVYVAGRGRALYDYATEASLLLPVALLDARFDATPFARGAGIAPPAWQARSASLGLLGKVDGLFPAIRAADALARLHATGWRDESIAVGAASTALELWRGIGAVYASAYLRRGPDAMPAGFSCVALGPLGVPGLADAAVRAAWWADGSGVPPGPGVALVGGTIASPDPGLPGELALRDYWIDDPVLQQAVAETAVGLPRDNLPVIVVHGAADGLVPPAFSADPYVAWLRGSGCAPVYWRVPHAQHFDAFLATPGFGEQFVPLLPYGYAALDRLLAHLLERRPLPEDAAVRGARPRGSHPLTAGTLGWPSG